MRWWNCMGKRSRYCWCRWIWNICIGSWSMCLIKMPNWCIPGNGNVLFFLNTFCGVRQCSVFYKNTLDLILSTLWFPVAPSNITRFNDTTSVRIINLICARRSIFGIANHNTTYGSVLPIGAKCYISSNIGNASKLDELLIQF